MLIVAHRSPRTKVECQAVADAGARVFEIDVQIWHGRLVVSHYLPVLGTVLRRDGWRFVRGWHERREPLLAHVAELVPPDRVVPLELKETEVGRRAELLAAIVATLSSSGRYLACTPLVDDLDALRAKGFRTWRTIGDSRQLDTVLAGGALADDAVTVNHKLLSRSVVDQMHARAKTVVAWTVNDVRRALWLRDIGADGVTTDSLDVMRAFG
jgi:glycerophosphoryl diester phosphodiesterase